MDYSLPTEDTCSYFLALLGWVPKETRLSQSCCLPASQPSILIGVELFGVHGR